MISATALLADASFWADYPASVRSIAYFLISGGFFMAVIGMCSVLGMTIFIWKALALRKKNIAPDDLAHALEFSTAGELKELTRRTREDPSVLGRISHNALAVGFQSKEEAREAIQAFAREEVVKMETGITALEVVITISPLLGLLGTVNGLVSVFSTIGAGGDIGADPAGIALGISQALNTTIAGLAVAVPAVVAHAYFSKKTERFAVRMEVIIGKLLATRFGGRDGGGGSEPPWDSGSTPVTPAPQSLG